MGPLNAIRVLRLLLAAALLAGCASAPVAAAPAAGTISILDGKGMTSALASGGSLAELLVEAGVSLGRGDRVLADGTTVSLDSPPPNGVTTLQVRRAVPLTLIEDSAESTIQTSAATVGQALAEAGIDLYAADILDPPASTPLLGPLTVTLTRSRPLTVDSRAGKLDIRSAASTVGGALAEGGIPLQGADYSLPGESASLPADGQIRVVRVDETVSLTQDAVPYGTQYELTDQLELDQQEMIQVGRPGLAVSRVRVRYEDGQETARQVDDETVVRPPQDRIIGTGTKVAIHTVDTPSGPLEYWRAIRVYATSYSPCRSAAERCYPGTAGGLPVRRGVVGVVRRWWYSMNGLPVYIPGYGRAVISDVGGGIPGTPWIDLGFTDEEYESWHQWVTMYFLTPVPASILYNLE
jgi:uncharacterized protein YabE (DUF348 family)